MTRKLGPLAALAIVALIGAGCSSGGGNDSGGGNTIAANKDGGNTTAYTQEKAVKFAACIREHGVSDFPDPNANGEFGSYGVSVTPAVWIAANKACKELQPPGSFSSKRSPEEQSDALRFAQCVREHGVKDFPDPVNGEPLIDTYKIPSSDTPRGMSILNAATEKCGDLLNLPAADQ
jgi:hypothetical protein